jgi:hypothetical protein
MTFLKRIAAGAAVLTISLQAPVSAQDCTVGIKPPPPGSWAEYSTSNGSMRLALLGNESRAGKDMVRIEMSLTSTDGNMIMQMLVPGYPYDMDEIADWVIKAPGQPAMRMSAQMMGMMRSQMPRDAVAEACRNSKMARVGSESVTVPAGTFNTTHYRDETSGNDVWVSENIPFGMVKAKTKSGEEVVLSGKGTDAKSQITETPQEMKMPN